MIVAANWKMNLLTKDILIYMEKFLEEYKDRQFSSEVIFFPSYPFLSCLTMCTRAEKNIYSGSQNIHFCKNGAYTGQVSAEMIKSLGCDYVLVGHSEYRIIDNSNISARLRIAMQYKLLPILCCGESEEIRKEEKTLHFIKSQLDDATRILEGDDIKNLTIAYEPIWSIGTDKIPTHAEIHSTLQFIKNYFFEKYNLTIKTLYGGSCTEKNVSELQKIDNVDGFLVGGASLEAMRLIKILDMINQS